MWGWRMFSSDSMGVTQTNPTPRGFGTQLSVYQLSVDWVSRHLRTLGYEPAEARYDPYQEQWHFRDQKGDFIAKVSMDMMERIHEALFALSRAQDPTYHIRTLYAGEPV